MKAARFYEKQKLILEDVPVKKAGPNDVKIKIRFCGVCGTDVHIYEGDEGSAKVNPPTILGHEFSGDVVEVGSDVANVLVGDRVTVDPNSYCGQCYYCANGKKQLCNEMIGLGTASDGGFAEYIVVKEQQVYPFSEKLSYEKGAMVEPVSCCVHGMKLTDVKLGDTVMVVGAGSIGLIMVQLALCMGAAKVIAVEPDKERREKAYKYGASILINPLTDNTEEILSGNQIKSVDKVIDCAGKVATAEYAIRYAGKGATVMLFGLTAPDDVMALKPFELFKKELTIKGSFVNPDSFQTAIALLENEIIKVDDIIAEIVELDEIHKVFEEKLYNKGGKVLIKTT